MKSLEDHIVESNLQNMPTAGIKNYVSAMQKLGRGRQSVLSSIMDVLQSREAYKDVKNNINLLNFMANLRK